MINRFSLFAILLLTFFSCRDDFTLEGEFQDIPVAYAYLDADDERHFIRVERAFLEAGGNALDNAANPDIIYYGANEATVLLRNLTTGNERELDRVDAREFGQEREDGIFAESPNIAYSWRDTDLGLNAGDQIELRIERPGEPTAVATTRILQPIEIQRPNDLVRIDNPQRPLIMSWEKGPEAAIYDVRVLFNIRELFPADAAQNRTIQLEWVLQSSFVPGDAEESGQNVRLPVDVTGFYRFLGDNLEPNPDVVRRFQSFDVQVSAAGPEVLELRQLQSANAGLTSSGSLPRYTNLENGIGLITSNTTSLREGVGIDGNSVDSLRFGQYTRDLGFQ